MPKKSTFTYDKLFCHTVIICHGYIDDRAFIQTMIRHCVSYLSQSYKIHFRTEQDEALQRNQRFFTIDSFEILISMCSCCDEFIWSHYLSFIVLLYLERKHHSFSLLVCNIWSLEDIIL
jgi:hypothetical protein